MNRVSDHTGIEIKNVTKTFNHAPALQDITLTFEPEKIYGLLGQNGAGKSTLLNLITNRIFPDSGTITIDGENNLENDHALNKLYLMSEKNCYPEEMKISQALKWSRVFYPDFDMDYAMKLLNTFKLDPKKRIKALSTGYTSIFKLVIALSTNAPYIFLDEPVLGLDANYREEFYKILLEKYIEHPCTIIISTHLIEEISHLIEDTVILKEGKVISTASKDELLAMGYCVSGKGSDVDAYTALCRKNHKTVLGTDCLGNLKIAYILGDSKDVPAHLDVSGMNLQKLFVEMTKSQGFSPSGPIDLSM